MNHPTPFTPETRAKLKQYGFRRRSMIADKQEHVWYELKFFNYMFGTLLVTVGQQHILLELKRPQATTPINTWLSIHQWPHTPGKLNKVLHHISKLQA